MSYSLTIEIKDNEPVITGQTAELPAGRLIVGGHEDPQTRTTYVNRYDPDGTYVASAQGFAKLTP